MDFLKQNKRFSFKLGEKNAWECTYTAEVSENGDTLVTVYKFDGGLVVTNTAKRYAKYGAYEWVNTFENASDKPTEIISELWDCNCTLPMENDVPRGNGSHLTARDYTKICSPNGSNSMISDFRSAPDEVKFNQRINHLFAGAKKEFASFGGRSSDTKAPFFNINRKNRGYIFAIGWTGQWNCEIERGDGTVSFRSKIEDTGFRLYPGEKIRTSSVVLMPYECDAVESQNKWRRLVKEHFSLIGSPGRDKYGPLLASVWGGMKSTSVIERVEKIKKNRLPYEYIWMDAGWYGAETIATPDEFSGNWYTQTGDWRVSPKIHPAGMEDVSKAIHDAGLNFLLWFEPERVICTTPIAIEHPEYFLFDGNEKNTSRLLDLGNPEAWKYCFETLSEIIEKLKIDCYRQDFNFDPLDYWRRYDAPDRKGITEIKHINGLYRLWDALLERFPHLIIDNCASGGRRIDIEMIRRSMPMWRSDLQCNANYDSHFSQEHMISYNAWMPYSGTGAGRLYDGYRLRSSYAQSLNLGYSYAENCSFCDEEEQTEFIKKYTQEYLMIRPYLSEDFYPLTEFSDSIDTWCAYQYNRPEKHDGVIQVFRRSNSPYEKATFGVRGFDKNREYLFTDADGGEFTIHGKELCENGFSLTISEKRCAKIYFYKAI